MIKLFTHIDLDGLSCYIVAAAYFGEENVSVEYCDYHNVNEKILAFLDNEKPTDYEEIFITDISVNEEVAEKLDYLHRGEVSKVTLLDHHKTALWLNSYDWAHVRVSFPNTIITYTPEGEWVEHHEELLESGTSFLYDVLQDRKFAPEYIEDERDLEMYAEDVRRYDTWDWHNKYNDVYPKELNDLLKLYGQKKYIEKILSQLKQPGGEDYFISETDRIILDLHQEEIDRYVYKKNKSIQIVPFKEHQIGVVFAESYLSELGNKLGELNPTLDVIAMINMSTNSVSLRTVKEEVDVSEIAKYFGGGGHRAASGMPIDQELQVQVVQNIFFPEFQ